MKINHHGFLVEQFQNERLILKGVAMKDKKRKPGSGGSRPGSGRKSLFKEKTKRVKFMCPISKESDLKKYVYRKFLEWSKSGI